MIDHELFRDWDAAYVLGSLSVDDRRRYERHLAECGSCAAAVAELAGLPGLLSKVSPAEAEASLAQSPPVAPDMLPGLLPRLVADVERRRRRTSRWFAGLGIAAVAAAIAAGVVVVPALVTSFTDPAPQSVSVQLTSVVESPLTAGIRLVEEEWGTRIDMECRYRVGDGYGTEVAADYAMYVTDAAGDEAKLATWTASPGHTATPSGTTSLPLADIRLVEVRAVPTGEVLLRGEL